MSTSESPQLFLEDIRSVNSANAVAVAWLVYDILLFADMELTFLRDSKRWTTKLRYIFTRYVTLLVVIFDLSVNTTGYFPQDFCKTWKWVYSLTTTLLVNLCGESLMMMRIWALYSLSKKVLALSLLLWIGEVASGFLSVVLELRHVEIIPKSSLLSAPSCILVVLPAQYRKYEMIGPIFTVAVDAVYFLLIIYKFVANFGKEKIGICQLRNLSPTYHFLVVDGALYFFALLVCSLYNMIILLYIGNRLVGIIGLPLQAATVAIVSSRMVLHLRGRGQQETRTEAIELSITVWIGASDSKSQDRTAATSSV